MNEKLREQLTARGIACAVLALPDGCKDVNEVLVQNRDVLQAACEAATAPQEVQQQPTLEDEFLAYLGRRGGAAVMSTGIAGLDKALDGGLHAGLTVLGAVSSMGKTSLMLQMADTLAAAGRNVLFITIEMSRMELIAKSAVRGTRERARPGRQAAGRKSARSDFRLSEKDRRQGRAVGAGCPADTSVFG
jgi:replicative DNA helicase